MEEDMARPTVVIENCDPQTTNEKVVALVEAMLSRLPGLAERVCRARRIFVKLNLGIPDCPTYRDRPIAYTDPAVLAGLAKFLRGRTTAIVLVGDGSDFIAPTEAARRRGHMAVVEQYGLQFVDLNQPPFARFEAACPAMFRRYELSAELKGVDLWFSVAKMKSHHLCGVTLSLKNLFGIPPNTVYASPRFALHSPIRLPRILADLAQICAPAVGLIDGIIGQNYSEWGGDPVSSGVLIAGDNLVATDAVGARFMGVDPQATFGTPPFLRADNHIRIAADLGLGPADMAQIDVLGSMPVDRKPYAVAGGTEPGIAAQSHRLRQEASRQAAWYFRERDRFAREYLNEIVFLGKGKVILHEKVNDQFFDHAFRTLDAQKLDLYETFVKLVLAEEAELAEPYAL
jgi:uncharacterized protein (DUF362 family)